MSRPAKIRIPTKIEGIKVIPQSDEGLEVRGQIWFTMVPEDDSIRRMWEFSISTGRILDMTHVITRGDDDEENRD